MFRSCTSKNITENDINLKNNKSERNCKGFRTTDSLASAIYFIIIARFNEKKFKKSRPTLHDKILNKQTTRKPYSNMCIMQFAYF